MTPARPSPSVAAACCAGLSALLAAGSAIASAAPAPAAPTVVTQSVNFDAPAFSLGNAAGQGELGGWNSVIGPGGGIVYASIGNARAYSGTQSLRTTADTRPLEIPLVSGSTTGLFMRPDSDWWAQARVFVEPGNAFYFSLFSWVGTCPALNVNADGSLFAHTCTQQFLNVLPPMGPERFNQWLTVSISHTANTSVLDFSVQGGSFSWQMALNGAGYGPGNGNAVTLGLAGDAFWDDVLVGTGPLPSPVPEPGTAWLWATAAALGSLHLRARRKA